MEEDNIENEIPLAEERKISIKRKGSEGEEEEIDETLVTQIGSITRGLKKLKETTKA